jgi:hypothetical protein
MMHIYSSDAMKDEFLALYKKDIEITSKDVPELPYPTKQKHYLSSVAKLQFAAT